MTSSMHSSCAGESTISRFIGPSLTLRVGISFAVLHSQSELLEAPLDQPGDRGGAAAELLAHFLQRLVLQVVHCERFPLGLRQASQRVGQPQYLLLPLDLLTGRR